MTIALVSGSTYQISGLAPLTAADGDYELIVSAAGVEDSLGDVGTGSVTHLLDHGLDRYERHGRERGPGAYGTRP